MSCGLQLLHPPIVMSTPPAPPPNLPFSEHHALPGLLCGMEAAREKWVSWLHPTPMTLYPQGFWDRSPRASWASQGQAAVQPLSREVEVRGVGRGARFGLFHAPALRTLNGDFGLTCGPEREGGGGL